MTRRTSPGRPPTIHARRVTVSLDDDTMDRLREIGDGNVSGAIRWLVGNIGNHGNQLPKNTTKPDKT